MTDNEFPVTPAAFFNEMAATQPAGMYDPFKLEEVAQAIAALQDALSDALSSDTIGWDTVAEHVDVNESALKAILAAVLP